MPSVSTLPIKDLTCAVCHNIFLDPIILSCSHSFCRSCLQRCWRLRRPRVSTAARPRFSRRQQVERKCPVCRSVSATSAPPCNLALRNLCQAFLEEEERRARPGFLCPQHGEKRKLYCMEDKEPMCVVCQTSKRHKTHECCPVDEVAHDYKEELRRALTRLNSTLKAFKQREIVCTETERYMKEQAKNTEKRIRYTFKMFHELLQDEEETMIAALKREEVQKSLLIKDQIDGLSKVMTTLEDKINAIEMELKAEDIFFLDNYKTTVERAQWTLQDPPNVVSESLINVSKHLGNLAFNIWEKMKDLVSYFPVILDPNTASPHLILESDLSGVKARHCRIQGLPDNPERLHSRLCVLGSEGFDSGTHSWEIEVGVEKYWEIGVMTKHDKRNVRPHTGSWMISHLNGKYMAETPMSEAPHTSVKVSQRPRRIRVQLDLGSGQLSFSDCETNKHLHTFRYRFTERLFPFISWNSDLYTARVMPLDVSSVIGEIGLSSRFDREILLS